MDKTHVVKLGGSMVSKSMEVMFDFQYFSKFSEIIRKFTVDKDKFFIALGGGYMMRKLRDIAKEGGVMIDRDLHWIGTTYNVVNAQIARAYLSSISSEKVYGFEDYYNEDPVYFDKSVVFGGGGRPGHSGDYDALLIAKKLDAKEIVSLKNIDGVYSADPKVDSTAKRIDRLTWDEYFEIIGYKDTHEPGGNYPVDPVTAKEAQAAGISFKIVDGNDLESFENALSGNEFKGSIVGG